MGLGGKPIGIGDIGLLQVIDYGMYMQGYIKQTMKMTALWLKGRFFIVYKREKIFRGIRNHLEKGEKESEWTWPRLGEVEKS